ncbi:MAG: tRNA (guanosine(46)-N7)-methyltransferase TrmB [Bacteroides sp.]|nr:tRNA (guanosine(46)-N7)-methyltransferase TrmB [Prevotella sp.]MCM1407475.1 tRNA (guanosine(46)-N7)-methyltransferase TrmB [Treponema brennaborense]MCM1469965.1 tRNA (guanosine(46)-N7)-methyltransferase TrmB [Bacteroides sp.]
MPADSPRGIKTFVLRTGRMTAAQKRDYDIFSGRWCIPYAPLPLNFTEIFHNTYPVTVEIGFGMGTATAAIAESNPNMNYLGIEVHTPGVGRLLGEIKNRNLSNLYIIEHDAVEVLENMFVDNSVYAFHIFFPDPWPKKKHHKRRFIQRPRTNLLAAKLAAGGYIYMATDWESYAESAAAELSATQGLENKYAQYAPRQLWRPETKFERKGLNANRHIYELLFIKK